MRGYMLPKHLPCPHCDGLGFIWKALTPEGRWKEFTDEDYGLLGQERELYDDWVEDICPACGGSSEVLTEWYEIY